MTKKQKIFNTLYEIISTTVITVGIILVKVYLFGIRLYQVRSGSMGELLPVGSICFVSTYSRYEDIEAGDVISFRVSEDIFVTHRAESITDEGIITKGDMNQNNDPDPVTRGNYIGKTIFAIPHIGRIFGFLHTFRGMLLLGGILILFVISGIFYNKKDKEK